VNEVYWMRISADVFDLFPEYCRGVVVATEVVNKDSPEDLVKILREEEDRVRTVLGKSDLNSVDRLESWRNAFKQSGVKPTKYRPSIDGLIRRVIQGKELPSINALVDIGNIFSLRYTVPVGGHAIDVLEEGMLLQMAEGDETFIPFGSEGSEYPDPGEIIFVDGKRVMTRRWVWRQAEHTLLLPSTRAVEFNIDALPPVDINEVKQIGGQLSEMILYYCGGKVSFKILNASQPAIPLDHPR
jgi:DNA/RNA-binding domain of Phe-tRNA-synthetase-like protein